jgi:hypothetical protein
MTTKHSFYIPRINCVYTIDDIIATFRLLYIGEVARVDINHKLEDTMSVFIHMNYLYDSEIAWNIVNNTYNKNSYYRLWIEEDVYWLLLKNNYPIEDTYLNIHQIAENARILEEKVFKLEDKMTEKDETIARLNAVVFKLIYTVFPIKKSKFKSEKKTKKRVEKNRENLKNIYNCVNMMHYGEFYDKDYLSPDEDTRNKQLLEQREEDLTELKWSEPWEENVIIQHYEPFIKTAAAADMTYFTSKNEKQHESNDLNSDDDTMPALISCYDSIISTSTNSSDSNNTNSNSDKSERHSYTKNLCGND